ncbi:hypothetical protein M153_16090002626, partial [Pseudoloma neurophilia]
SDLLENNFHELYPGVKYGFLACSSFKKRYNKSNGIFSVDELFEGLNDKFKDEEEMLAIFEQIHD